jgi:hypothetical protein
LGITYGKGLYSADRVAPNGATVVPAKGTALRTVKIKSHLLFCIQDFGQQVGF